VVDDTQESTNRLLDEFFGTDDANPPHQSLVPWIERLRARKPTILPASTAKAPLRLYAVAPSIAAARGLAEELLAAIGPSWSDFDGSPTRLDPDDPIEAALLTYQAQTRGGPTLRATVRDREAAWAAMKRLIAAWERRPEPRDDTLEPLSEVLRDVELALQTSAVAEAARLLTLLRTRGELSSQNLLFMELRLLAASGRWTEVLRHPRLDDVLSSRRPIHVTTMLADALDEVYFAKLAAAGDAREAIRIYRDSVRSRFATLLTSGPELDSVQAVQLRLFEAICSGAPLEEARELSAAASADERGWLKQIADLAATVKPIVSDVRPIGDLAELVAAAREAAYASDYRQVMTLLADSPPTLETAELQIGAAVAIRSLKSARQVAQAVNQLSLEEQETLLKLPLSGPALRQLLALGGDGEAIGSWAQWFSRLNSDPPWEAALEIAELGSAEWPAVEPEDRAAGRGLATALTDVPDLARVKLERALPHLLAYLDRRSSSDDAAAPVYSAILEVLAYGDSRSRAVREAAIVVLARILSTAPATDTYEEVLLLIEHFWDSGLRAPKALNWWVDVLVILVDYPCSAPEARAALVQGALADAAAWRGTDRIDVEMLVLVAADPAFGSRFAAEIEVLSAQVVTDGPTEAEAATQRRDLAGLRVGIYTLTERVGIRAKTILNRRFPNMSVELNHEHDGSDRLRGLSRRADVMAVVIASAQHAATDAIRRSCRADALLEVGTEGSTGLVRAILERLDELAAA
jgi:hypothetical protein